MDGQAVPPSCASPNNIKLSDKTMGKYARETEIFFLRVRNESMNPIISSGFWTAIGPANEIKTATGLWPQMVEDKRCVVITIVTN